jgi:hypothetical protein
MTYRLCSLCACAIVLSAHLASAEDRMRYREFALGSDLASVATLAGTPASTAEAIHERPAVMKDLEWRPRYSSRGTLSQTDPVDVVLFSFYDDQLFRVTVNYARNRIEGLTEADLIEAISTAYGPSSKPVARTTLPAGLYGGADTPLARWGDTEYSVTLLRVAYPETFRLVVSHTRLENLARTAAAESLRLDTSEAPQRELARRKKEADEALDALKKASIENKAVFRP